MAYRDVSVVLKEVRVTLRVEEGVTDDLENVVHELCRHGDHFKLSQRKGR